MKKEQTIEFTRKQFLALLKTVYLGNWIANAHTISPAKNDYEEIENLIFSYADKFGLDKYVDHQPEDGTSYFPTRNFEESTDVHTKIREYEEESFWDELIDRMARATMLKGYSKEEIQKMSKEEFLEKLGQIEDELAQEFEEYGLARLKIDKSVSE